MRWYVMPEKLEQIALLIRNNQFEKAQKELEAGGGSAAGASVEQLYLRAYLAERWHEWDRCLEHYEQVLARDPDHTETLFRLAHLCDLLGDDERALQLYERCVVESPAHVNALMNLAVLYEDHGRYEEALECLEAILEQYPNHARARLFRKDVEASCTMYYDEDQERMREKRNAVLDTPIGDFELSVRSRNCLKQMSIRTLGDLLATSEQELLAYKNFGETSLKEIKAVLAQTGLSLGQSSEDGKKAPLTAPQPPAPKAVTTGDPAVLQRQVSEVEFSVRSRKCLQRLGIATLGELAACTEAELLAIKNFGQTSLIEIKRRLVDFGLLLGGQQ
ncbi:MAG: DNA-directed RNA polymerase subunit alpha C-terminal domain-containing protein [Planctomycetota bacterium]